MFCNTSFLYLIERKTLTHTSPCLSPDSKPVKVGGKIFIGFI